MADIVSKEVRSVMMSGIRGKNTQPELFIRKKLFAMGFRYRLHVKKLPGSPDIVLPKYRAAIFVNGCFWHGHDCRLYREPKTNSEFWKNKIDRNRENDKKNLHMLELSNWRVMYIWECALKNMPDEQLEYLSTAVEKWLLSNELFLELRDCSITPWINRIPK